jgi:ribonucleoside-diphosphate reductase alpha subunit
MEFKIVTANELPKEYKFSVTSSAHDADLVQRLPLFFTDLCTLTAPLLDSRKIDGASLAVQFVSLLPDPSERKLPEKLVFLLAETCAYRSTIHPAYESLAARILVSWMHGRRWGLDFPTKCYLLAENRDRDGLQHPLVSDEYLERCKRLFANDCMVCLVYERDYQYSYFGLRTLLKSYLLREGGFGAPEYAVIETPQDMIARYAIFVSSALKNEIDSETLCHELYEAISQMYWTPATPSLFNAGTLNAQMSSCFLLQMIDDSLEGIYDTLKECALVAKSAGGVGLAVSNIRARGSPIKRTNGVSNGITPMLRTFNETARYVDQGGGKRKGAFAIYLEPWHADVFEFIDLRRNTGDEKYRARDLFLALWIPDLFMRRVRADEHWTLFCPTRAPGLCDVYGEEFDRLYMQYEADEWRATRTIKAAELWLKILESHIETGVPYMLSKDQVNRFSNQNNLGTIRCSNLCTEIQQYSSPTEIAVCNLSSLSLPRFFLSPAHFSRDDDKEPLNVRKIFDFPSFERMVRMCVRAINCVIDVTVYPLEKCRISNIRHRPMGLGVQGLADLFILARLPFESVGARTLSTAIFEALYYYALDESIERARIQGAPYGSYEGSRLSKGLLHFDGWPRPVHLNRELGLDWDTLRQRLARYGAGNSLLVAPMPTASTSSIMGNTESVDALGSVMQVRRVLAGEFIVLNAQLVRDLESLGLWDERMRNTIRLHAGSVQNIEIIPLPVRELYKNAYEMKQRAIVDLAAYRAPFIDQSQSHNLYFAEPTVEKLSATFFYSWNAGLKTWMYYLRTMGATEAASFTVDEKNVYPSSSSKNNNSDGKEEAVCRRDNPECESCSA